MKLGYLYQIYTEHREALHKLVSQHFSGFTLLEGEGYWKGVAEHTAVIVIMTDFPQPEKLEALAKDILDTFNQEAVLLTIARIDRVILSKTGAKPSLSAQDESIPVIPLDFGKAKDNESPQPEVKEWKRAKDGCSNFR